jgi:hypothetical protein
MKNVTKWKIEAVVAEPRLFGKIAASVNATPKKLTPYELHIVMSSKKLDF